MLFFCQWFVLGGAFILFDYRITAFSPTCRWSRYKVSTTSLLVANRNDNINEEYVNPLTRLLGAFVQPESISSFLDTIKWDEKKRKKQRTLKDLAAVLEKELSKHPDVKIKGIENYARGVNKIFSQKDSRAEIIAARVNNTIANTITVTWRLEGTVKVGLGLKIKPFVVFTDYLVDESDGLIVFQLDRFSNPGPDILLSSLFPFLIGKVLLPPAPSVDELKAAFLAAEKNDR